MVPRDLNFLLGLFAAFAAASLLTARAWFGPIDLAWFYIHSPLPIEGIAVFAFFLLNRGRGGAENFRSAGENSLWPVPFWLVAAVIVAVFSPNLSSPFVSDDYILTRFAPQTLSEFVAKLWSPGGDGAYRPVGYLYFEFMHQWAGFNPFVWHCASLLLHVFNCFLTYALGRQLWGNRTLAGIAALLFGVHGTRPEVVSWVAGAFDLWSTCFVLAALAVFFSSYSRRVSWPVSLGLLCLAILCKESAYSYPLLVVCLAVAAKRFDRFTAVYSALATALCAAFFAYRYALFGGPGGYLDRSTGKPQILSLHLASTLKALLLRVWVILSFPINWKMEMTALASLGIGLSCIALATAAYVGRRTAGGLTWSLLGAVVAGLLPAIHLALIGDDALGSRILYLPALGFAFLVAHWLTMGPRSRKELLALCLFVFAPLIAITEHNLQAWRDNAAMADAICGRAAKGIAVSNPPAVRKGVFLFANGFGECVRTKREMRKSGSE